MGSTVTWLDSTPEEQRIARELIALFTQQESRDELGIGQVRDAFSELLFPGTSVIQTRARYYLFVPWCYRDGRARGSSGDQCRDRGDHQERRLITALQRARLDDAAGLIGVRVGASVRTLPSAIYWGALRRYGMLTHDVDVSHLGLRTATTLDSATELVERHTGDWDAGLPDPPPGFPDDMPSGFTLSAEEAGWVAGRISVSVPTSALRRLIERRTLIPDDADYPWDVLDEGDFDALGHARRFSAVLQGASLLYNLVVAERYESRPELTRLHGKIEEYRDSLGRWHEDTIAPMADDLTAWDVDAMWSLVEGVNTNIQPATRVFVNAWVDAARRGESSRAADDRGLRHLVEQREARKGKQSRLRNDKLLAAWSGASGAGRLDFRWGTVRRLVNDVVGGQAAHAPS